MIRVEAKSSIMMRKRSLHRICSKINTNSFLSIWQLIFNQIFCPTFFPSLFPGIELTWKPRHLRPSVLNSPRFVFTIRSQTRVSICIITLDQIPFQENGDKNRVVEIIISLFILHFLPFLFFSPLSLLLDIHR